jgi:hypothetical protein
MLAQQEKSTADRLGHALASAMPIYRGLPANHRGRWRPTFTDAQEPWVSHLEAYAWEGEGFAEVSDTFLRLGHQLRAGGRDRVEAAAEIFNWGFPGRATNPNPADIDGVVGFAVSLALDRPNADELPTWSAYWTKVACAATIDADLVDGATPQVIWDSRVATAVCLILDASDALAADLGQARIVLKVPQSRPNTGLRRRTFERAQTTAWMYCHGTTSLRAKWRSQAFGSRILAACARRLNEDAVGGRSDWKSFDVGAALFVEGY